MILPTSDCAGGTAEVTPELIRLPGSGAAPPPTDEVAGAVVAGADCASAAAAAVGAAAVAAVVAVVPPLPASIWSNEDPALLSKPINSFRQLERCVWGVRYQSSR